MKPLILRFIFKSRGKIIIGSYQCKCHGVLDMHNEAPYEPTTRDYLTLTSLIRYCFQRLAPNLDYMALELIVCVT